MYPAWGLGTVCDALGYSRQAYYKHLKASESKGFTEAIVVKMIEPVRKQMPRLGGKKLHYMIQAPLFDHHINMGRDRFFNLLSKYGLLVRRRKRRKPITTDSDHPFFKYPNLIRELEVNNPNQLWVSDITYIPTGSGFSYLSLITDAYSRKIVGWCLRKDLRAEGAIEALKMAIDGLEGQKASGIIHHSDRGLQYCCKDYVKMLTSNHFTISMTENGDPYENAIAERVNGILKTEFNLSGRFDSYQQATEAINTAINTYNNDRPHASCNYFTPQQAHKLSGTLKRRWSKTPKRSRDDSKSS